MMLHLLSQKQPALKFKKLKLSNAAKRLIIYRVFVCFRQSSDEHDTFFIGHRRILIQTFHRLVSLLAIIYQIFYFETKKLVKRILV